ncbi:non-ribosomal peptide synthetase [Actinoplanes sp. N902-109]|uniref:non-ribosomal peptide synthetase n=1 Tax=Actinoplanes sp. (strain N902-109) TaxID=649831 RepID=UPI0003296231|nr:non-ribosomal peptide synthetase [Actinoplanes sp. N902-109]AGL12178.2 pipecolate incorporating enzyme [Actinoplanes sp. N902-109]AGL16472.1 pipecolate incorporating enzyme [Actinoplanes sp. N902-109]
MASTSPRPKPFAVSRTPRLRRAPEADRLRPVDRDGPLAASFAQQRLWLLQQITPDSNAYNLPLVQRLRGALDPALLSRALSLVVRRHEALRTVFDAEDGEPRQRIRAADEVPLRRLDARDEEHARSLARQETAEPFDLHTGPVLRASLIRLADDDHVLAITLHHIASDGWSLAILQTELSAQYAALLRGGEAELPALPVQYADFAQWERKALSGARLQRQLDYWQDNLRDAPTRLQLPTDRPRPATGGSAAGLASWSLPAESVAAARALSRSSGATLFMTLLAAFQVVLARAARTDDVLVATPLANRNHAEVEGLIGMFVNTAVLRGDLSGDPTFRELLRRTRVNTAGAFAHAELPFDLLVERIAPVRDLSINPVVQVLFQLMPAMSGMTRLPGGTVEPFGLDQFFTRMDLEFHVYEDPAGAELTGQVWFSTALFDAARVEQLLDRFTAVLEGALEHPDEPLSTIAAEPPAPDPNDTARALPVDTLPELLAAAAVRTPDAVAVVDDTTSLTYAELHRRANRLAHLLVDRGVRPGELVGVCLDRGAGLIVAILGVLKAGAAYVPLDPEHPAERTRFVLADSGMTTVVTQHDHRSRFAEVRHIVSPDDPALDGRPDAAPQVVLDRDSLAYAIYTSGSTGRPKAVLMPGISAVNLLLWQERTMGREPDSRTAQFVTATFDYSVQEIFSALLGGTLVIPADDVRLDPARLAQWLDEQRITRIYAPTTVLRALIEHVDPDGPGLSTMRQFCQGGEALVLDGKLRELCRNRPHMRVHNHYGPAETQLVTGYTLPADVASWPATAPIGPPIDNTRLHILDDALRPVPDGVPGQLGIAGIGLARGYLARPELTAERFITGSAVEPRMYLSGDLARRLPDGNLEFLGRIDTQVKIRGIRIELGEIETVLTEHPAVAQAAVTVHEDDRGEKRLVAYVVTRTEPGDLRAHVAAVLPAVMVPSVFVSLAALPLTTSGKTDRRALPRPQSWSVSAAEPVAPRNPTEATVCGIYADVLAVPSVGVHDDFFALGGHSLLASRVVSRVRAELGCELPLRTLFDDRTPARIAEAVGAASGRDLPALVHRPGSTTAPLSLAQQQLLGIRDSLLDLGVFPVSPYGFRLTGTVDRAALDHALTRVVARHEPLRTGFRATDGGYEQVVREPAAVRAEYCEATEDGADELVRAALARPFDLAGGLLLRALLIRIDPGTGRTGGEDDHLIVLMVHHIAGDGWSFDLLVREVSAWYAVHRTGVDAGLPEIRTSYSDFAWWERDVLAGPTRTDHETYWRTNLSGAAALELPADRPRRPGDAIGRSLGWTIPPEVTQAARQLARAEGVTLFELMLGAFATAAAGLSGRPDIMVATPFANRGRPEIDHLIGFFAKAAALRVDLSDDPPFRTVLRRVHEVVLGAHTHQDLPYATVRAGAPELPPPLVQFQLISSLATALDLPGVAARTVELAQADLGFAGGELAIWLFDEDGAALTGSVVFNGEIFDPGTIHHLLSAVESAVRAVAAAPSLRVSQAYAADSRARS